MDNLPILAEISGGHVVRADPTQEGDEPEYALELNTPPTGFRIFPVGYWLICGVVGEWYAISAEVNSISYIDIPQPAT